MRAGEVSASVGAARGLVPPDAVRVPAAPMTGRRGPVRHGTAARRLGAANVIEPGVSNGHGQTVADERHAINTIAEAPTNPTQRRTSDQNTPRRASSVQTPTVRTDRPNCLDRRS
jgi:hypothetical protein